MDVDWGASETLFSSPSKRKRRWWGWFGLNSERHDRFNEFLDNETHELIQTPGPSDQSAIPQRIYHRTKPWKKDEYDDDIECDIIGGGSFGKVFPAKDPMTLNKLAIKQISVPEFINCLPFMLNQMDEQLVTLSSIQLLLNETNGDSLSTEYIVKCGLCWFEGPNEHIYNRLAVNLNASRPPLPIIEEIGSGPPSISPDFLYISMERCDMDLSTWLESNKSNLELHKVYEFWGHILEGLGKLHERKIIHRDMKPQNILLKMGSTTIAKIGDLGLSTKITENKSAWEISSVGTEKYKSPEMKQGAVYDCKTDIFSTGLIFLECIAAFTTKSINHSKNGEYFNQLRGGDTPELINHTNKRNGLITKMCKVNATERLDTPGCKLMLKVIQEELLTSANNQLLLIAKNANKRLKNVYIALGVCVAAFVTLTVSLWIVSWRTQRETIIPVYQPYPWSCQFHYDKVACSRPGDFYNDSMIEAWNKMNGTKLKALCKTDKVPLSTANNTLRVIFRFEVKQSGGPLAPLKEYRVLYAADEGCEVHAVAAIDQYFDGTGGTCDIGYWSRDTYLFHIYAEFARGVNYVLIAIGTCDHWPLV